MNTLLPANSSEELLEFQLYIPTSSVFECLEKNFGCFFTPQVTEDIKGGMYLVRHIPSTSIVTSNLSRSVLIEHFRPNPWREPFGGLLTSGVVSLDKTHSGYKKGLGRFSRDSIISARVNIYRRHEAHNREACKFWSGGARRVFETEIWMICSIWRGPRFRVNDPGQQREGAEIFCLRMWVT